jgi:hypothetical protein
MRWGGLAGLVALAGCRQIFGIGDPGTSGADAPIGDSRYVDGDLRDSGPPVFDVCNPLDAALVGCWDFDGTVRDSSFRQLDIIASGTPPSYVPGHSGQAIVTDTTDLNVPEITDLDVSAVTIEAWLYVQIMPTGNGGGARSAILDNNNEYAMYLEPSGTLRCYAGAATADATSVIKLHQWTHVACTADGSKIVAYVDGAQIATGVMIGIPSTGTTGLTLGSDNPSGTGSRLIGRLDGVRLYGRVLSALEICRAHDPGC